MMRCGQQETCNRKSASNVRNECNIYSLHCSIHLPRWWGSLEYKGFWKRGEFPCHEQDVIVKIVTEMVR